MKIECIETFYDLCKTRSFLDTSTRLNLDKSSISRRISSLEKELGHKLLERSHGEIVPTEKGDCFLSHIGDLLRNYYATLDQLNHFNDDLSGPFSISTTHALCSNWLSRIISGWIELHPKVQVNLICSSQEPDLAMNEADVMLRPKVSDRSLIQEYVRSWDIYLYASQKYATKMGLPQSVDELKNHRLIAFGDTPNLYSKPHVEWHLPDKDYSPFMRVNSLEGLYNLIRDGVGIGTLTNEFNGTEELIPLLREDFSFEASLYLIYQKQKKNSRILRSFREFIFQHIKKENSLKYV